MWRDSDRPRNNIKNKIKKKTNPNAWFIAFKDTDNSVVMCLSFAWDHRIGLTGPVIVMHGGALPVL